MNSKFINWLKQRKKLIGTTLFGVIAVLIFGATFSFLPALEISVEAGGEDWIMILITGLLTIAGVVFVILSWRWLARNSFLDRFDLLLWTFLAYGMAPVVSMYTCVVGLIGFWLLLLVIYPKIMSFSPFYALYQTEIFDPSSVLLLSPATTFLAAGTIVVFYFLVGLVWELKDWIVNLVKKGRKERRKT